MYEALTTMSHGQTSESRWTVRLGARPLTPILTDATKTFSVRGARHVVFSGLNLALDTGVSTCIVGPNGCGKSTLMRILLGLDHLDSGKLDYAANDDDKLGAVLQNYRDQLLPWATIRSNLLIAHGGRVRTRIETDTFLEHAMGLLSAWQFAMPVEKHVRALSGGQQQALVLARALSYSSRWLLWDEPLSAIDYRRRRLVYETVGAFLADPERGAIVVTHDLDEALLLGDRVLVYDVGMSVIADVAVDLPWPRTDQRVTDDSRFGELRESLRRAMLSRGNS